MGKTVRADVDLYTCARACTPLMGMDGVERPARGSAVVKKDDDGDALLHAIYVRQDRADGGRRRGRTTGTYTGNLQHCALWRVSRIRMATAAFSRLRHIASMSSSRVCVPSAAPSPRLIPL